MMQFLMLGAAFSGLLVVGLGSRSPTTIKRLSLAMVCALVIATTRLGVAFYRTDTRFSVVIESSRRATGGFFRLAGLWGGARASLLVWTLCGGIVTALEARRLSEHSPDADLVATKHRVQSLAIVTASLALLSALVANPFVRERLPPTDGRGLSPILEHPAMLWHPPLVYAGLMITMLAWAYAMFPDPTSPDPTVPAQTSPDPTVADQTAADQTSTLELTATRNETSLQRLLLFVVLLLGTALLIGALWAYDEQGWGGYWAWDPVENGGLLPWLLTLSALHAIRSRGLTPSTRLLAGSPFIATCIGSIATRSGVMPSVHAFAEQRTLGWSLFGLTLGIGATTAVVVGHSSTDAPRLAASKNRYLSIATIIGVAASLIVALGTYAPIVRYLATGDRSQTTGPFFSRFLLPLVVVVLGALGVYRLNRMRHWLGPVVLLGSLIATAALHYLCTLTAGSTLLAFAAVASVISVTVATFEKRWSVGSGLAHAGFALLVLGFAGSLATSHSTTILPRGTTHTIGHLGLTNFGVAVTTTGNRSVVTATIGIHRIDPARQPGEVRPDYRLYPKLIGFPEQGVLLSKPAIQRTLRGDVYVALLRAGNTELVTLEIHDRPLVWLVWTGSLMMLIGVLSLITTRNRPVR